MTVHQPLYEIDKANMQELYIFWGIAALLIAVPVALYFILQILRYRRYCHSCSRYIKPFHRHKVQLEIMYKGEKIKMRPYYVCDDCARAMRKATEETKERIRKEIENGD